MTMRPTTWSTGCQTSSSSLDDHDANTGDLIACGTNHEGLGPLQDGESVEIELEKIGRMGLHVIDPLKRTWDRGIYIGADSTNPDAVKRHRPQKLRVHYRLT